MDYTKASDETLMRFVTQANADALSELYDRYSRLVFSMAFNILGDGPAAEEVTLDVFTLIWEKAGSFRAEKGVVRAWLTRITRNRAIDSMRRRSSRPEGHSVRWAELSPNAQPIASYSESNPEKATERAISRERVRAAVAQLPANQKEVLVLAYFGGYTQRQIAEALGQPLGTVKTRIRLAMVKLRKLLND